MSEDNTTPEHNGILVVANNYRRNWGTGNTVQQARKNGYGIRKTEHQTIYYHDINVMHHPSSDAAEKDKVKGEMVYEEQNSEYEFNEANNNWGSPTYMKKADMVEYEPGKWRDKKFENEAA